MEIVPNVHVIPGVVVNVYLLIDTDGLTLIDTGLAGNNKKILKYIAGLSKQPSDLKRIILTHSDGDHVGALAALKAATGARAYASPIEAKAIQAGHPSRALKVRGVLALFFKVMFIFFKVKPATIDETLSNGEVLPVLGGLRVVETIGHTPGHISLFAPSAKILFAGDSMTASADSQLRTSRGRNTWDEAKAIEAVKIQAALGAQIVCVGHGPIVRDAANKFPQKNEGTLICAD